MYKFYFLWAFIMGFIASFTTFICLNGIVNKEGQQLDFWNIGFGVVMIMSFTNYSQSFLEFRNITWFVITTAIT